MRCFLKYTFLSVFYWFGFVITCAIYDQMFP